ncbi:glutamate synthase central domain-containing protein [Streptomyces sp. NPDC001725]|uniref:glutamate synthase central domain-containing protein n=1 Tax=Streptomyces sp. NPDC001725 TaxID=3156652 RepID=UPI0033203F2A
MSERPRLLFDYFTQLFAQVTNPPLDALRRSAPPAVHEAQVRPGGGGRSTRRSCGGSPRHRCACPCRTPESP